jgi:hypothetical protein
MITNIVKQKKGELLFEIRPFIISLILVSSHKEQPYKRQQFETR